MMANDNENNFESFSATCARFVDILRYDEYHLDVVGALLRLAELHKREVAELRECLKEGIDEKCISCKAEWYGKCLTKDGGDCELIAKWRKALEGGKNEGK